MTKQTRTALAAALAFVTLAILISVLPVPFVTWTPGSTLDTLGEVDGQPVISISGIETHPTTGQLDLTTVGVTSADSRLTLPQAVAAYWLPHRDALPRDSIYAPDKSPDDVQREETLLMQTAQEDAIVAALRQAGEPVQEVPVVESVTVGGPAHGFLQPGDLVLTVDGVAVSEPDDVGAQIRTHAVGDLVRFDVLRNRVETSVDVATSESATSPGTPVVGITVGIGYSYEPQIAFDLGQQIGGSSAGLVFALAIYDKITTGPLLEGRHVAGTGTIDPDSSVGPIGGIQEKVAAAENAGATEFLVPADNCADLAGVETPLLLIKVSSLGGAADALVALRTAAGRARVPVCG